MEIGSLSKFFGTRLGMALLGAQLGLVLLFGYFYTGYHSSDRCVRCHADKGKMESLGYPQFVMTREQVQKEARHPNTECRDCHLGNGLSDDPGKAHRGMLKLIVLDNDLNIISRKGRVQRLLPSGNDRMREMLPHTANGFPDDEVGTLLWHDRNTQTLGYDPRIAEKTCGKAGCHPDQVKQFATSVMGANYRQRSMTVWDDVHGPNN